MMCDPGGGGPAVRECCIVIMWYNHHHVGCSGDHDLQAESSQEGVRYPAHRLFPHSDGRRAALGGRKIELKTLRHPWGY